MAKKKSNKGKVLTIAALGAAGVAAARKTNKGKDLEKKLKAEVEKDSNKLKIFVMREVDRFKKIFKDVRGVSVEEATQEKPVKKTATKKKASTKKKSATTAKKKVAPKKKTTTTKKPVAKKKKPTAKKKVAPKKKTTTVKKTVAKKKATPKKKPATKKASK